MNPMDTVSRFSAKVEKYEQYRWDFTTEAIDKIFEIVQLSSSSTVADIGSGTGMVAQHFVERVQQVFAIEPNFIMRELAIKQLGKYSSFISIDALSDRTLLPAQSVDLITVGRAIHWFNSETTKSEFLRILKPQGWLAILKTPCLQPEVVSAIKSIKVVENGWDIVGDKYELNNVPLSFYYNTEHILHLSFPEIKYESWQEFRGRLLSLSSAPNEEHPLYVNFEGAAKRIFDTFSCGDRLALPIATDVYLGQVVHDY